MDDKEVHLLDCWDAEEIECIYKPWDEQELLELINKDTLKYN